MLGSLRSGAGARLAGRRAAAAAAPPAAPRRPLAGGAAAAPAARLPPPPRASMRIAEHAAYLEEVAVAPAPRLLPALLRALRAQGRALVAPSDRAGLHPLVVPLAALPAAALPASGAGGADAALPPAGDGGSGSGDLVLGLLRWPDPGRHKGMTLPVVAAGRGAAGVRLLARSVDEYLHRMLAEEDAAAGPDGATPLADAASEGGAAADVAALYSRGAALGGGGGGASTGGGAAAPADASKRLGLYLARKAGAFPDVCEALALGHLSRGDVTSALVTAEWYMRPGQFPGWGRPYEFAAELYRRLGKREEECRDVARLALRSPWWSLASYAVCADMAQLTGTPEQVRWVLGEEAAAQRTGAVTGLHYREAVSPVMAAVEEAEAALDFACASAAGAAGAEGLAGYDAARAAAADAYERAGLADAANFLRAI